MAILFKTTISEISAFEMIERSLSGAYQYDGYLNVVSYAGEAALPWSPASDHRPQKSTRASIKSATVGRCDRL
ncbi:hypothetical protein HFN63_00205 [Rhizobium leguminosarum]|uniref:hypothetical protein n=1 Tax=Rhizobium leguminosarum TaxID=384 RepID=UPI001C983BA8|nr:hypothetical protein [Rhizobium leguminosarum]MBY5768555.1 hypothetical protein [Rhizobium leguminosarum]